MSTDGDSFFSRWSRRKAQERAGVAVPPEAPEAAPAAAEPPAAVAEPAPPPPTLEDTQTLSPASDFSRFVARDVAPEVRNAAVKKLFADPHFNRMDGLDIYIDDYTKTESIPAEMMARMVGARFLKLVDDPEAQSRETIEAAAPGAAPPRSLADPGAEAPAIPDDPRAPDAADSEETPHDEHADLQLQPDHAPGLPGPGPGTG